MAAKTQDPEPQLQDAPFRHPLRVAVKIRPVNGGSEVTVRLVDLTNDELLEPITDFFIAGLTPYEGRVQIAASTSEGGINHEIDNVVYQNGLVWNNDTRLDDSTQPVVLIDDFETTIPADAIRNEYLEKLESRQEELRALSRRTGWRYTTHVTDGSTQKALLWLYNALELGV